MKTSHDCSDVKLLRVESDHENIFFKLCRTVATRDRNSPLMASPRVPRVHNIPIRRELESSSTLPLTKPRRQFSTESQEMCLDISAELSQNSSFDFHNNSAEVEAILSGTKHGRFVNQPPSSIKSYDDRSLDEMSIHDQLLRHNDGGQLDAYRQRLVSDIQVKLLLLQLTSQN